MGIFCSYKACYAASGRGCAGFAELYWRHFRRVVTELECGWSMEYEVWASGISKQNIGWISLNELSDTFEIGNWKERITSGFSNPQLNNDNKEDG